jgi:type IV secretory pathway protease TraF
VSRSLITSPAHGTRRLIQRLVATVSIIGCAGILVIVVANVGRHFVWNLTSSVPRGLYVVRRAAPVARGALVTFRPPGDAVAMISARHYLSLPRFGGQSDYAAFWLADNLNSNSTGLM